MADRFRVLVVEDDRSQADQARQVIKANAVARGIEVVLGFAYDGRSAFHKLFDNGVASSEYAGVLTDIMMPYEQGSERYGQIEPCGIGVASMCYASLVPCVIVTQGYHHGDRYQWICDWQRQLGLPEIVDTGDDYSKDSDKPKNWAYAWGMLLAHMTVGEIRRLDHHKYKPYLPKTE